MWGYAHDPKLTHKFILYSYIHYVVLSSYNVDDMQHLLHVLDLFDKINELIVNIDKTKIMAIKAINQDITLVCV